MEVALQSTEHWSNVCKEEEALQAESNKATEAGHPLEIVSRPYAKGAFQFLVFALKNSLTKQKELNIQDD